MLKTISDFFSLISMALSAVKRVASAADTAGKVLELQAEIYHKESEATLADRKAKLLAITGQQ